MRTWKALTAVALEGTSKGPVADDKPERQLLKEAGWHTLTRLAARRPDRFAVADTWPAPDERRALVSRAAAARLEEILRTDDREHLREWLAIASRAGKRVPASLLPPLLERGAEAPALRRDIMSAGGLRVGWLAHHNEEWAFADIADPDEAFKSGIRAARVAALAVLRQNDPASALETLAASWQQEGGDDRTALIAVLAVGLGPHDEQFLTSATSDGRKEVRTAAAALLARLPTSALIARMTARADTYIHFKKGMRGAKLEVSPPAECTEEMIKDGIEPKPPKGVGEKAHWLRQVVALVPPSHWMTEIVQPGLKSEWAEALLVGWTEAAVRFQDASWCNVLIEHYLGVKERWKIQAHLQSLVRATPPASLESLIDRKLGSVPRVGLELVMMSGEQLSAGLSERVMNALEQELRRWQKQQDYWLAQVTRTLRAQLDPVVLPKVVAATDRALTADAPPAAEALQALAATLEYRAEMAKEILN